MNDNVKQAFDFASDLTKQLIALSTAIITLSVTFSTDIIGSVNNSYRNWLFASWLIFILSILFGILTLMALTGNLDPIPLRKKGEDGKITEAKPEPNLTITSSNVTGTLRLQVLLFMVALILSCVYGYFTATAHAAKKNDGYMIIRKSILNIDSTRVYIDTLYLPKEK